jgi:DNA-binding ferritin-like protein
MGKLLELMQPSVQLTQGAPNPGLAIDNMLAEWGHAPYAELSVILVHLRYLNMTHQTHHWIAKADAFYGDHQLFDRLYNSTVEEIDQVAEKAVGMGGDHNVNLSLQAKQVNQLVSNYGETQSVPLPVGNSLARLSLLAEVNFVAVLAALLERLRDSGQATHGIENLLQGIADNHETNIYLLKRRCTSPSLGA